MNSNPSSISETELELLKVLWDRQECTVREMQIILQKQERQGRNWAYTTVQTLLNRLEAKKVVTVDRDGAAHVYRPALSREQLLHQRLNDLADQLGEGTSSPLVLALVEGTKFTKEELDRLRKLLDQLEAETPPKKGKERT